MNPEAPTAVETRRAVWLFVLTLLCVYSVYGFQWMGGNPFVDPSIAMGSAKFALALMAILLAHEMGHYIVARRHGFSLSLPYFIPFPAALGTFGAIIRLRTPPTHRTALLEMGAAGPLAGFVVAAVVLALGLPGTEPQTLAEVQAQMVVGPPPSDPGVLHSLDQKLAEWAEHPPLSWLAGAGQAPTIMILLNPPLMDILGLLLVGGAPGRYDTLDPLAMAGWVGCLLTAINLVPIGQLDGGHILNALAPNWAPRVTRPLLILAIVGGIFLWPGWALWAVVIWFLGAWRSIAVVDSTSPLTPRARAIAVLAMVAFLLCFMPQPVDLEQLPLPVVGEP